MGFFKNATDRAMVVKLHAEMATIEASFERCNDVEKFAVTTMLVEYLFKAGVEKMSEMSPDDQALIGISSEAGMFTSLIGNPHKPRSIARWIFGTLLIAPHMPVSDKQAAVLSWVDRFSRASLAAHDNT